jgi:hypothetical protein
MTQIPKIYQQLQNVIAKPPSNTPKNERNYRTDKQINCHQLPVISVKVIPRGTQATIRLEYGIGATYLLDANA